MTAEPLSFRLEQFEGPLDLLLTLVEKHRLNIEDIPIDLLCEQYTAAIRDAESRDVEIACEFLEVASELMLIKSRMLLPRDPKKDEDPRRPLVDALAEYQRAKLAAAELSDLFGTYGSRMVKEEDDISPDRTYVADHSADLLRAALTRIYTEVRLSEKTEKEAFSGIVNVPRVPVEKLMTGLIDTLKALPGRSFSLTCYLRESGSVPELVAKFIGILELVKVHLISVEESGPGEEGVTDLLSGVSVTLTATDEEIAGANLESGIY